MVPGNEVNFELFLYTPVAGNEVNFELDEQMISPFFMGLGVSGKLGEEGEPDPLGVKGIYQMRMTRRGKVPIKMRFYRPTNPETVPQQANRQKFADAMAAWGSLTEGEKAEYNTRAKRRRMFGWGLFIREYYSSH